MPEVEPKGWRPRIDPSGIRPKLFCSAEFLPALLNGALTLFFAGLFTGFGPADLFVALGCLAVSHGILMRVAHYDPQFFAIWVQPGFPSRMPALPEVGAKLPPKMRRVV